MAVRNTAIAAISFSLLMFVLSAVREEDTSIELQIIAILRERERGSVPLSHSRKKYT